MKQISRYIILFSFLMVVFIFSPSIVQAQGDPGCDPLCNCRADGSICPIDSWLLLLIATVVGYGLLKFRSFKKNRTSAIKI